jgi:phage repressor protein C with HTH and peptisase S24 domain
VFDASNTPAYFPAMKIGDRLKQIMEEQNLTANALAEKSGVPQPTISRIVNGSHGDPRTKTLEKIASAVNYSVAQLRDPSNFDFVVSKQKEDGSTEYLAIEIKSPLTNKSVNKIQIPKLAAVPSMGNGEQLTYDGDQIIDVLPVSKTWLERNVKAKPQNLRVITGAGDSMHPTFSDGDMLLVDVSKAKIDIDGVYVLSAHERLFIKRVRQRMDGSFEVSSDNPTVKTVDILNGDHEIQVHGRVVWAWNGRAL